MADNNPVGFQLALALALIKSKPDGIPIREHIENLRPSICVSQDADKPPRSYLDTTGYWRNKHKQSFEVFDELQSQLSMQRFQLEQLQAQLNASKQPAVVEHETTSPSNAGRKRVSETPQPSTSKKRKVVRAPIEFEAEDDLESLHDNIGQDARSLFVRNLELRRLIDENNAFAAVDLAYALQRATTTATRLVVLAATEDYSRGNQIIDDATFRLLLLTINNTFHAFGRLVMHRTSPMQEIQNPLGAAIYSIVNMFRSCLRALKDASASGLKHNERRVASDQEILAGTSSRSVSVTHDGQSTSAALVAYIKDIMKAILTSVVDLQAVKQRGKTTKIQAHTELYEGIQHILLTEAGKMMYNLTFSGQRADSIEKELETREATNSTRQAAHARHVKAASIAARHLFPLVRHAVASLPADVSTSNKKRSSATAAHATVQRAMTSQPFRRLQNTLVQGVFGVSEEDDLEDALRLPAEVVMQRRGRPAQTYQDEGGDWFVKSMWELCGWDFLAKVA